MGPARMVCGCAGVQRLRTSRHPPVGDPDAAGPVHEALAAKDLLPCKRLVRTGHVDADQLVASARDHGIELIGPTLKEVMRAAAALGRAKPEKRSPPRAAQTHYEFSR